MVHICGNEIVERILNIIKRNKDNHKINYNINYKHKMEHIDKDIYHDEDINNQMNIKERIAKIIRENEKYFVYEVMRTTADTILYDSNRDMERLKRLGYSHRISVDIFEKYGIFLYVTDLSDYVYAPRVVKHELQLLIYRYGLEKVAEEVTIYLKENYPNQFGMNIVCTP